MINETALNLWKATIEFVIDRLTSPDHYSARSIGRVESLQDVMETIPTGQYDRLFDDERLGVEEAAQAYTDTLWEKAKMWMAVQQNCKDTEMIKISYIEDKDEQLKQIKKMISKCQYLEDRAVGYAMASSLISNLMEEPVYNSHALQAYAESQAIPKAKRKQAGKAPVHTAAAS